VEPASSLEVAISSSPLDEGEEMSSTFLGGGTRRAADDFVGGIKFVLVGVVDAAERRRCNAVEKAPSVPFELDACPSEEPVAEEDSEASMRDKTDKTEFLFWADDSTESKV
jgi:hypothetical protein